MITSSISFYPCISIEETDKFYSEVIGLEKVFENGSSRIFSCVKGHFGFVCYDGQSAVTDRLCLSLNCDSEASVDKEYERITSLGIETLGTPSMHPNHPVYSFFIKDPNGYLVEFQKLQNLSL